MTFYYCFAYITGKSAGLLGIYMDSGELIQGFFSKSRPGQILQRPVGIGPGIGVISKGLLKLLQTSQVNDM